MRGREAADWTQLHELVATQVDVTAALHGLTYDVNRPKGARPAPRFTFPRPDVTAAASGEGNAASPPPTPLGTAQDLIAALGGAAAVSVN